MLPGWRLHSLACRSSLSISASALEARSRRSALRGVGGYLPQDFGVCPNLNAVEFLGTRESRYGMGALLFSCVPVLTRELPACFLAGVIVALLTGVGVVGARLLLIGH
jgi:hypothetical protein